MAFNERSSLIDENALVDLPQDLAKCFSGGCHVALCSAGYAHRPYFRRAREWAVEQAFCQRG